MADNIDEKLINSVFNYEILYDLGNQYYYDTARKCGNSVWYSPSSSLEAHISCTHIVLFVLSSSFSSSHFNARDNTNTSSSLLSCESLIVGR